MIPRLPVLLVTAIVLSSTGCCRTTGSPAGTGITGACATVEGAGLCFEYTAAAFEGADEQALRDLCDVIRGTWRDACPEASRTGICTVPDGSRQIYYPPFEVHHPDRTVEEHCFATGGVLSY